MRTTVDLDPNLLARAKQLAAAQRRTLSAVVGEALGAYLGSHRETKKDPPFELLVCGDPKGRFPSPHEIAAIEAEEDLTSLAIPPPDRSAAP